MFGKNKKPENKAKDDEDISLALEEKEILKKVRRAFIPLRPVTEWCKIAPSVLRGKGCGIIKSLQELIIKARGNIIGDSFVSILLARYSPPYQQWLLL